MTREMTSLEKFIFILALAFHLDQNSLMVYESSVLNQH